MKKQRTLKYSRQSKHKSLIQSTAVYTGQTMQSAEVSSKLSHLLSLSKHYNYYYITMYWQRIWGSCIAV